MEPPDFSALYALQYDVFLSYSWSDDAHARALYGNLSGAMAVFFAPVDLPPEVQRTVARGERPQGHDLGMPPQPCLPGLRWLSLAIAHR
jgi:hypothetical protein